MKASSSRGCAVSTQLRRMLAPAVVCALALAGAPPAGAAVTIGQLPPTTPSTLNCTTGFDYLQPSVTGGELYTAREAGTITTWSTNAAPPAGATYTFKVFRRTSDPETFQAIASAPPQTVSTGLNTFAAGVPVESGDMIGLHETGPVNSCTFSVPGDSVMRASVNVADGQSALFAPEEDRRLNLSAVLDPANAFTLTGIARRPRFGTALVSALLPNPGIVTMTGKGLKKRHASRSLAVKGPVSFSVAATGKPARRLHRTGHAVVQPTITFTPDGGAPSSQTFAIRLKQRRQPASL
jgi:hypothetical protein